MEIVFTSKEVNNTIAFDLLLSLLKAELGKPCAVSKVYHYELKDEGTVNQNAIVEYCKRAGLEVKFI